MNWNTPENKKLIEALLSLKTPQETKSFLGDLMTENEIAEFGKRLKAAGMLSDGYSYTSIEKETGFSSTTVARVSRWLNNGYGGYKTILNRIHYHMPKPAGKGLF